MLTKQITNQREKLLGLVREFYGRVVYSHKTHEKEREIISSKLFKLRCLNVGLIGATFLSIVLGATYPSFEILKITSIVLGALSLCSTIVQLTFSFENLEASHRQAAKKLLFFRDKLTIIILKLMSDYEADYDLSKEFENISKEVTLVYEYAPDTSARAYELAQEALKKSEEMFFSEAELDALLPEALRLNKTQEPTTVLKDT